VCVCVRVLLEDCTMPKKGNQSTMFKLSSFAGRAVPSHWRWSIYLFCPKITYTPRGQLEVAEGLYVFGRLGERPKSSWYNSVYRSLLRRSLI